MPSNCPKCGSRALVPTVDRVVSWRSDKPEMTQCFMCGYVDYRHTPRPGTQPIREPTPERQYQLIPKTVAVPCQDQVIGVAKFLRERLPTLGLIGMEFAFFHQFFNPALQDRLKRVRR